MERILMRIVDVATSIHALAGAWVAMMLFYGWRALVGAVPGLLLFTGLVAVAVVLEFLQAAVVRRLTGDPRS